jgi:hypothetical protein
MMIAAAAASAQMSTDIESRGMIWFYEIRY